MSSTCTQSSQTNKFSDRAPAAVYKQGRTYDDAVNTKRLVFHTDQASTDLISLLSIGAAPKGGHSKWVSAIAVHNELIRRGRTVKSTDNPPPPPPLAHASARLPAFLFTQQD